MVLLHVLRGAAAFTSTLLSHGDHSGWRLRFAYRKYASSLEAGNSKDTLLQPAEEYRRHKTEQKASRF